MKILLLGGTGQLGSDIISYNKSSNKLDITAPKKHELDITNKDEIERYINNLNPKIIVNSAAYTDVDNAEDNVDICNDINVNSLENISSVLVNKDTFLIHISTDYVFGKKKYAPFLSSDEKSPTNEYGKSKSKGEDYIINNLSNFYIIRTASLMGLRNKNFFNTIIKNIENSNPIQVIDDQAISITWSYELAKVIINLCIHYPKHYQNKNNIFHITNRGYTNWYKVSAEIESAYYEQTKKINKKSLITPISFKQWESKAKRPTDSRLQIDEDLLKNINSDMSYWKDAVREMVRAYLLMGEKNN